jgi:hypothetical protein
VVVPDGHDEDHSLTERSAHLSETSLGSEDVLVSESSLLGGAEGVGDGVAWDRGVVGVGVRDHEAVLYVEALDFREGAGVGAVVGDELGDYCEGLGSVDGQAGAVEGGVAHAVGVEITSVGIAKGGVAGADTTVCA